MNAYSRLWFETFLPSIPPDQTGAEVTFLARYLPRPAYNTVLDVCCGWGRHACRLATLGYVITGLERDAAALDVARRQCPHSVIWIQEDMRHLARLDGRFNGVLCLWQSFGYFDEATNADVLAQMAQRLHPNGRLILDIYHRRFFEQHQGRRTIERGGQIVTTTNTMQGNRLSATVEYGRDGAIEQFDWQLYLPEEMHHLAATVGLQAVLACSDFNEQSPASPDRPRMQLVYEKA